MKAVIETFKDIPGYEGLYQVSDYGAVRSLNYQGKKRIKYLKNEKMPNGYERIVLCRNGKPKRFMVHRLVLETFVGKIPDGYEIDHINAVCDDNRLSNLRVVTHKENMENPISVERNRETGRRNSQNHQWREAQREGARKALNKTVLQLDKVTGEVIRRWECARDASRELGIDHRNISACCRGKLKSAGGFRWCFADQT